MTTFYRKYRPQNFVEVLGQNHIKITLQNEIEKDQMAHAYVFCGPRAVGKTTLARVFSKTINCENLKKGNSEPCNECDSCKNITDGKNLDIIEIDAASHTGVDNVRENIISSARIAPSKAKYKVFIIDEVHMLSISAFNALLKLIEEPPKHVVFILCTTEIHKVPATIISRCQRFDFRRMSVKDIVQKLSLITKKEKIDIDKGMLEEIARHSDGHMRDAESLFGQVVAVGGKKITREEAELVLPKSNLGESIKFIDLLAKKDSAGAVELINRLVDDGVSLKIFIGDTIEILRKMMFALINPELVSRFSMDFGESVETKIASISKKLKTTDAVFIIEMLSAARGKLKDYFITQLPLEMATITICQKMGSAVTEASPPVIQSRAAENTKKSVDGINHQEVEPVQSQVKANTEAKIDKGIVESRWNEFLEKIKKYNHSLSFVLKVCEPRELTDEKLCLAFKYKLHKDRLDDPNIKKIVESTLLEVFGKPLAVEAIVDENIEAKNLGGYNGGGNSVESAGSDYKGDDNMLNNLLKTFGGKVVS